MPLRLGPWRIPWWGADHRDDPYWDLFVHRPVRDPNNLVSHIMASAPEGNVNPALADLHSPEVTARHVKELAAYLGADLVGITRVDPDEQYGEQRPFAIVCGVRAPYDPGRAAGVGGQAPAMDTQYASFVVAAYIRELGYQATAAPDARAAALAARAGLGQLSPEGRLVTPAWGESVHVAEVIRTDLPLQADG